MVTTSPPIDLVAQGLQLTLSSNAGVPLADLTAPAGSNWSANHAGTTWKYRNPSASSGIISAKVRAIDPSGTLRVQLKARPRAWRRTGGHPADGDDRVRRADGGAGTVRRHGVRRVPDDSERGDDAVSVRRFCALV